MLIFQHKAGDGTNFLIADFLQILLQQVDKTIKMEYSWRDEGLL